MNCKQYQEKILDSLAAGAANLSPEIAAHQNSCTLCAEFYQAHQRLFHGIDTGLQSLVNQPVPPSLLPTVRARLDENPMPQRAWFLSWNPVAVAALAILAVAVSYALHRPHSSVNSGQIASTSQQHSTTAQVVRDKTTMQADPKAASVLPGTNHKVVVAPRNAPASSVDVPEVIVLAEERQAFAKFIADAPVGGPVVLAMAQPANPESDEPIDIALLRIEPLEVQSMDVPGGE